MSSRPGRLASALCALILALPAAAQVQSSGLDDLNPWSASLLERSERGLDSSLWSNSDSEYLLALMERLDVSELSRAERDLLSLALRSPADPPGGEMGAAVQAERLRLLAALNERRAAITLARQAEETPDGFDAEAMLADDRLARGEFEIVCQQRDGAADGRFWAELRAMCALAEDDLGSAELAIEIAAQQEGADPWVTETAIAVLGDLDERPAARYGSGLQLALSDYAGLDPDAGSLSPARPDLAARIAKDEERPLALRVAAANLAARAGELSSARHREIYEALISQEDFEPETALEAALVVLAKEPEPSEPEELPGLEDPADGPRDLRAMNEDWIEPVRPDDVDEDALEPSMVDEVSLVEEQALALGEALRQAAEDPADFAATSRLFYEALQALPANEDSAQGGLVFAAAALAAGNGELATHWLDAMDADTLSEAERVDAALLRGYALMLRSADPVERLDAVARDLLELAIEPGQQRSTYRLFSVWAGMNMPVPVTARSALAQGDLEARRIPSGMLAAIETAEAAGASGEALLTLLTQTDGAIHQLSGTDLASVLATLREMGAGDEATALALEAGRIARFARR